MSSPYDLERTLMIGESQATQLRPHRPPSGHGARVVLMVRQRPASSLSVPGSLLHKCSSSTAV